MKALDFEVWRDNGEEWPAVDNPDSAGIWSGATPSAAVELAAQELLCGEWISSPQKFIAREVGTERYYEIDVALSWSVASETPLDIASIREDGPVPDGGAP